MNVGFSSDFVYQVTLSGFSISLERQALSSPFVKTFRIPNLADEVKSADRAVVVEIGDELCGVAALELEEWNHRAILRHLYVVEARRRTGVGRGLFEAMLRNARELGARCLWVETQNTNDPAIQFYLKSRFRFCGLDDSLYEHVDSEQNECGIYFVQDL